MQQQSASRTHVVDVSASPFAQLRPVPIAAVKLGGNFWAPRIDRNLLPIRGVQHNQANYCCDCWPGLHSSNSLAINASLMAY